MRSGQFNFFDRAFENEMNFLIEQTTAHFDSTMYKLGLKTGLFDYQNARSWYRDVTGGDMHRDLVLRFIETQTLLLAPIAPHWSEYIWRDVLKKAQLLNALTDYRTARCKMPGFRLPRAQKTKSSPQRKRTSKAFPMLSIKLRGLK